MKKVAIFGVPRSGTSWLAHIFNSHPDVVFRFQPLFSYGHKGRLNEHSSKRTIERFFEEILHSTDPFTLMQTEAQRNYPTFRKSQAATHIVFKETRYLNIVRTLVEKGEDVTLISIIRNPLSVLASWMNAPREFNSEWDITKEWRHAQSKNRGKTEEFFGFEKWKIFAHTCLDLSEEFPGRFKLIRYEDLKDNTKPLIESVFNFADLQLDEQVVRFINETISRHEQDPYSVYRARSSTCLWKHTIPRAIADDIFDQLRATPLAQFLPGSRNTIR